MYKFCAFLDEQAVKTFGVTLVVDKIGAEDAKTVVGDGSERGEGSLIIEDGVRTIFSTLIQTLSQKFKR